MKILFIADFFYDQVQGGAESHSKVLLNELNKRNFDVFCINCTKLTTKILKNLRHIPILVSNFAFLSEELKKELIQYHKYRIILHDHLYVIDRNPANYKDYVVPKYKLQNLEFFANAEVVFCQSQFHKSIILKNVQNINLKSYIFVFQGVINFITIFKIIWF